MPLNFLLGRVGGHQFFQPFLGSYGPSLPFRNAYDQTDDGPRAILQELRTDPSIYLVETIDLLEDIDLLIDDTWEWIFREQLNGWMRDPDLWPE